MKQFIFIVITLISFYFFSCVKSTDHLSSAEKLFISKPWIFQYTDSTSRDANNVYHYYRVPATSCALEESLIFLNDLTYRQKIVCNQPAAIVLKGQWDIGFDSILFYGLDIDTSQILKGATIHKISKDTLQLILYRSVDSSVNHNPNFVMDTYIH